jgi:hypothetical protein
MPTLTDRTALLAALDAGDDSVILILADCLEEECDPLAAGLRMVTGHRPLPQSGMNTAVAPRWLWVSDSDPDTPRFMTDCRLPQDIIGRLPSPAGLNTEHRRYFRTRSAAYLALAQALVESQQ